MRLSDWKGKCSLEPFLAWWERVWKEASSDLHWLETLAVRLTQGAELSELEALPTTEDVVSA